MIDYAIKQTVAPTAEPVTLDEVKTQLRVTTSYEDAFILDLIRVARDICETATKRQLMVATWRLTLSDFPAYNWQVDGCSGVFGAISLPRPPLISVTSVVYLDGDGVSTTLTEDTDYSVYSEHEPGFVAPSYDTSWPTARDVPNAVTVTYKAGYASAASVPTPIKQAILLTVGHLFENREATTLLPAKELPMAVGSLLSGYTIPDVAYSFGKLSAV